MNSINSLINSLPPYQNIWKTVNEKQTVNDIIKEILAAHDEFSSHYDDIAFYFDGPSIEKICNNIFSFLKKNIKYKEESEDQQTSALPGGILNRRFGDCKHYAGFAAGILSALERQGKKINWKYVFASYKIFDSTPHHVFVIVNEGGKEFWIDPTPGAGNKIPAWTTEKKVNSMALKRNIAGFNDCNYPVLIGDINTERRPFWQLMPAEGVRGKNGVHGGNPYFSGPFLGLEHYKEDPYSVEGTDWNKTADELNKKIFTGPSPGKHTVNGQFTKWIYEKSMKGWNFYYPMGVQDDFAPALPGWYPKLVIDSENKLAFDRIYQVDDFMNDEIHALTAWGQSIINDHSTNPYPLTTRQVKEYSQGRTESDDLFVEDRGQGFLKEAFGFLKTIVGAAPRNAYLGLIAINAFGMATKLKRALYNDDGTPRAEGYNKILKKWRSFGGNDQKLENTVNKGAGKPAILGNTIGAPPAVIPAWVAIAGVIIAAITPLVKVVLDGLKKKTGIDYNLDPGTGQPYPDPPKTGQGFDIIQTIKDNPLPAAAIGAGVYFLFIKKKKVNGLENVFPLLAAGALAYLLLRPKNLPLDKMRDDLLMWVGKNQHGLEVFNAMTKNEISDSWAWVFSFVVPDKKDQAPDNLKARIMVISEKYKIFT